MQFAKWLLDPHGLPLDVLLLQNSLPVSQNPGSVNRSHRAHSGKGLSGPTNLSATSHLDAQQNFQEALAQAIAGLEEPVIVEKAVLGLSGFDTADEQQAARNVFSPAFMEVQLNSWTIVNDSLIALESGTQNPNAIVLISGTGSNCMGKNESGKMAHVGGMDFLLSDEGSGYAIGREVLRSAVRSADGRGEKTRLEKAVKEYFSIDSINQLKAKVYNPLLPKHEVAKLASACLLAANEGDSRAKRIIEDAVNDLFVMVKVAMEKLSLQDKSFDLVLVGGLIKKPEIYEVLGERLRSINSQINIVLPEEPPVMGAIKLARK